MQGTENLNIGSNNEIERSFTNEAQHRSPDTLKKMAAQSRMRMSGYNLAMFKETPGPNIKTRDRLRQQEAPAGQSINWLRGSNGKGFLLYGGINESPKFFIRM